MSTKHSKLSLLVTIAVLLIPFAATSEPLHTQRAAFKREPLPAYRAELPDELAAKAAGELLFKDTRLSNPPGLACLSCHRPELGWVDGQPRSIEMGSRRSMPLWNLAWDNAFTWSGRAGSIASQAMLAMTAQQGMNVDLTRALPQVLQDRELHALLQKAFQDPTAAPIKIGPTSLAVALEIYVRSLVSPVTQFDRWVETGKGLNDAELDGFKLFVGKARCSSCHVGWRFSDSKLHDIGVDEDPGAGAWLSGGQFKFKTIGLRDVKRRVFFMHNGGLRDLRAVVQHYNTGGIYKRSTNELKPLNLSNEEIEQLVEFLNTL